MSEMYVEHFERIMQGWPQQVNNQRRELIEVLNLHSLPGKEDEQYRHFDLRELFSEVVSLAGMPEGEAGQSLLPTLQTALGVTLINGICTCAELSRYDDGIITGSLRTAASQMPDLVMRYYNTSVDTSNDVASVLCGAFCQDGAFVYIPGETRSDETIHIDLRYSATAPGQICFPRILVIVEDGASANIAVTHNDTGKSGIVSCFLREVFLGAGSSIDITEATSMEQGSMLVSGNYSVQQERSVATGTALWLSGGATRINSVAYLNGRDSETTLYGLYFANGKQLCDINMKVRHEVADCRSYEVIKGVVSGEGTGSFTGMVYVAPDAQKTSALQQSRNLQLSDAARIYTEPQLEIYADDVKCSHGATVGQLDDQAVYYMRQRGISEQDARRLQLGGFVNDVVSHCRQREVCQRLSILADERIADI